MVPVHGLDAGLQNLAVFPPGSPPLGEWAHRVRFRVVRALGALCREWVTAATTRNPRALLRRAHDGRAVCPREPRHQPVPDQALKRSGLPEPQRRSVPSELTPLARHARAARRLPLRLLFKNGEQSALLVNRHACRLLPLSRGF